MTDRRDGQTGKRSSFRDNVKFKTNFKKRWFNLKLGQILFLPGTLGKRSVIVRGDALSKTTRYSLFLLPFDPEAFKTRKNTKKTF